MHQPNEVQGNKENETTRTATTRKNTSTQNHSSIARNHCSPQILQGHEINQPKSFTRSIKQTNTHDSTDNVRIRTRTPAHNYVTPKCALARDSVQMKDTTQQQRTILFEKPRMAHPTHKHRTHMQTNKQTNTTFSCYFRCLELQFCVATQKLQNVATKQISVLPSIAERCKS